MAGSAWATWEPHDGVMRGLTVGGGFNSHSGEHYFQYVSLPVYSSNSTACQQAVVDPTQCTTGFEDHRVPAASLVNLMAAYHHNWGQKRLSVQVNIRNLIDSTSFKHRLRGSASQHAIPDHAGVGIQVLSSPS